MSLAPSHRPAATTAAGRLPDGFARHRWAPPAVGRERRLQIALGLLWLGDGALQLQPFMFRRSFVTQIIAPNTADQPGWVSAPIAFAEHLIEPRVALFNGLAATLQILIGLGLLYRPTIRIALIGSVAWALGVWWIGEGLGGLFTGASSPLTEAPGAALLYLFASVVLWPGAVDGVVGVRGALAGWALLWLGSAALWLLPANRAADAVHDQVASAPAGATWLASIEANLADAAAGHGLAVAIACAVVSAAIGLLMAIEKTASLALALTAGVAVPYFVVGQGLGGILTGWGTDPGTGPLFLLLALALYRSRGDRLGRPT